MLEEKHKLDSLLGIKSDFNSFYVVNVVLISEVVQVVPIILFLFIGAFFLLLKSNMGKCSPFF